MTSRYRMCFCSYFSSALMLCVAQFAHAATINVTAGAVDTVVNGNCSLIEAIQAAETDTAVDACPAGSGADTINVPAGTYTLTAVYPTGPFTGSNGLPLIASTITLTGAGAGSTIITRGGATLFRFFIVDTTGNLTLNGVTLTNGDSDTGGNDGGAIRNYGILTVVNSALSGNISSSGGSAIFTQGAASVLNITGTTISGNTGSAALGTTLGGTTTITNSTLSGNDGGIDSRNPTLITLHYSTIAGNTVNPGINLQLGGAISVNNSIVANNATNCSGLAITDGGNNLQFPGTTCGAGISSADPLLGALASNGGTTQTMALSAGSPAIDAGNTGSCPATDQRGTARPQGPACDIGAFELGSSPPPPPSAVTPVPALQEWALVALALMLGLLGIRRGRYR